MTDDNVVPFPGQTQAAPVERSYSVEVHLSGGKVVGGVARGYAQGELSVEQMSEIASHLNALSYWLRVGMAGTLAERHQEVLLAVVSVFQTGRVGVWAHAMIATTEQKAWAARRLHEAADLLLASEDGPAAGVEPPGNDAEPA